LFGRRRPSTLRRVMQHDTAPDRSSVSRWLAPALTVAALVLLAHLWNADTGLYLDDHAHYHHLAQAGWRHADLIDACRLPVVGGVAELWFAPQTELRFYRPLAFLLMKVEYTVCAWQPWGMHLFSLLWHWLCAMAVAYLAWLSIGSRLWATVAGGIFAVHPAHVLAVQWVACQTELMVTFFALLAIAFHWRYAAWPKPLWHMAATDPLEPTGGGERWWLLGTCLAYAAALGCRENAVVIPALLLIGDWMLARRRLRRRLVAYMLLGVLTAAYWVLRDRALEGSAFPGRPYLVGWSDPDFVAFVLGKFAYSLIGLFGFVPVLPGGGLGFFRSHPVILWGGAAAILAGLALLAWRLRPRRGVGFWSAWIGISLAPLLPVFCSAHHLYLPGVGMAVLVAGALALLARRSRADAPERAALPVAALVPLVLLAAVAGTLCWASGWVWRAGNRLEDLLVTEVAHYGRPIHEGDKLFFINLPLVAYYATPAVEQATGRHNLTGYVLTFAPSVLGMTGPCHVQRLSPKRLSVSTSGEAYFGGAMGRLARDLNGGDWVLRQGQRMQYDVFDVTIARATPHGVQELIFDFDRPLDSPDYHFYLGSRLRLACELDMACPPPVDTSAQPDTCAATQAPRAATASDQH